MKFFHFKILSSAFVIRYLLPPPMERGTGGGIKGGKVKQDDPFDR